MCTLSRLLAAFMPQQRNRLRQVEYTVLMRAIRMRQRASLTQSCALRRREETGLVIHSDGNVSCTPRQHRHPCDVMLRTGNLTANRSLPAHFPSAIARSRYASWQFDSLEITRGVDFGLSSLTVARNTVLLSPPASVPVNVGVAAAQVVASCQRSGVRAVADTWPFGC
jgi:hypothetical protein